MTGQQKEERTCTLQDHLILNEKEKGITHTKNRFQEPPKRTKIFKKGYIHTKTTFFGQRKMSKQTNDLSKPFQKKKRHGGKKKNH